MCGINLIIDKQNSLGSRPINKMSELVAHRGPDDSSTKIIKSNSYTFHLNANRLKITDQSDGAAQPFIGQDSKQALLFNGEIYNFYDLKNELLNKNVRFSSHSDTEVLFHWIREYGKDGIKKLAGMFACIFIDFDKNDIIIARDRFGIKPIYFFENDQYFIASSEIKSIIGTGLVAKELNVGQIHHYLLYKYVNSPETFYKKIYELEHGHVYHFHENEWLNFKFFDEQLHGEDTLPDIEKIETLITDSLTQQLNSHVPLGLLLSGGVDSTLLLALAQKEGFTLPTFSIVNSKADKSFGTNDYRYSRLAASRYTSDHHEVEMDISILNRFDQFIDQIDQPIGDSSYLMTSAICKNAAESMKILLSGAGADEIFAGYNRHWAFYNYLKNKNLLNTILPILNPFAKSLPTGRNHSLRKQFRLMKKWSISHDHSPMTTYKNYMSFTELNISHPFPDVDENDRDWFSWALSHDQNNYLVSDVLALSDKASMLHGVELRVPYLNENLIDYLNKFSSEARIKKGTKWILKEILTKYGGKKFVNRKKEGFGLPLSSWLFDKKSMHLWKIFDTDDLLIFNYLDREKFDELVDQQKRKAEDHGPLLWSILVLTHWLQRNFG